VVPLRSIEAHLGDRRYSSCSFLTWALEGGEWSASLPGRALPPGKEPPVPTVQEAGWAPEPVWTQRLEEKSSASVGYRTPAVRPVDRHYTVVLQKIYAGYSKYSGLQIEEPLINRLRASIFRCRLLLHSHNTKLEVRVRIM
jgi:hypothetical protein